MTGSANAHAQAPAPRSAGESAPVAASPAELRQRRSETKMPGEEMTIAETLRVMDVAREMREQRESAEEMFRHDEVRVRLRKKLMRTAELSGDRVTEAEIDAAIDQYLAGLHTYQPPKRGFQTFMAHCWIYRYRIAAAAVTVGAACSWLFF
ncbi:hypothetical protein SAMN06265222_101566 [Neorhodopirellula lusitana]|uniref:Uncharacterized protein n=1 Tax=Neorhodopirellula lusitana TaxID=445327 RepID=A0ABY1PQM6_9BACT|nr:DUF6384 family protein [Neorhodopirellula lusitana]SMP41357.1 hypothetical protein SAMN06265222_101566 [Neorhodopirellula lusitana]